MAPRHDLITGMSLTDCLCFQRHKQEKEAITEQMTRDTVDWQTEMVTKHQELLGLVGTLQTDLSSKMEVEACDERDTQRDESFAQQLSELLGSLRSELVEQIQASSDAVAIDAAARISGLETGLEQQAKISARISGGLETELEQQKVAVADAETTIAGWVAGLEEQLGSLMDETRELGAASPRTSDVDRRFAELNAEQEALMEKIQAASDFAEERTRTQTTAIESVAATADEQTQAQAAAHNTALETAVAGVDVKLRAQSDVIDTFVGQVAATTSQETVRLEEKLLARVKAVSEACNTKTTELEEEVRIEAHFWSFFTCRVLD